MDHPVVPLEFAHEYAGGDPHETLRRLREQARGEPVVTLGERGALYFDGRRVRRHPARKVRVVDTTGPAMPSMARLARRWPRARNS